MHYGLFPEQLNNLVDAPQLQTLLPLDKRTMSAHPHKREKFKKKGASTHTHMHTSVIGTYIFLCTYKHIVCGTESAGRVHPLAD